MSLRDAATRTAILSNLASRIDTELKAAKKELQAELKAAKEQTGTQKVSISLPNGAEVGTASLVQPKPAAVVTDEDAFLKWVLAVRPGEVVRRFVTEVRPSWQSVVLKELTAAGVAQWCDKDTGEVHDVPGVEMQGRAAYTRVSVPDEGAAAIEAAWRARSLADLSVPQIAAGGAE